jgi:O-succinylbenzoic acid--CoA ligase
MQVEAWLQRAACSAPTLTALQAPEGRLSYGELLGMARAGADELSERGVRPDERVAIALPAGLAFAQALHACWLLGAVAVPIDLRLTSSERERIIEGASLVVGEPLSSQSGKPLGEALGSQSAEPGGSGLIGAAVHELDAVCAVIYTSGTTSAPRPIELTYGNFLWSAIGSAVALGVDPRERWLCALPLSHVGGLSILVRSAIYATTAVIHERFHTDNALRALEEDQITLVSLVATTLARLLDAGLDNPPRLRCALTGGGPVPAALVRRARAAGVPVIETYGLTECCSQAATAPLAAIGIPEVGAGVPLFCTRTEIVPAQPAMTVAGREVGEIVLSGPTVARGARSEDGRLHTGDQGWLDEHSFLHVSGRETDTIVSGGENVSPSEVEGVIEAFPGVLEAAVLGREDPHWGEAVTAIIVVASGESVAEEQLREYCSSQLAPFKVPKRFELASAPLPRTRSGKLLRREL